MTYRNGDAIDAARHNQIDRRLGGIIDLGPPVAWNEGAAGMSFGTASSSIELQFNPASTMIRGREVRTPGGSVALDPTGPDEWRRDHIFITESGSFNKSVGRPSSNEYATAQINPTTGEPELTIESARGPQTPAVESQDLANIVGELIYTVTLPPDTSTAGQLTSEDIQDRRREAIQAPKEPWEAPNQTAHFRELAAGGTVDFPFVLHANTTFRLFSAAALTPSNGNLPLATRDLELQLFNMNQNTALWSTTESPVRNADGSPLATVDIGAGSTTFSMRIDASAISDTGSAPSPIGVQASWTATPE